MVALPALLSFFGSILPVQIITEQLYYQLLPIPYLLPQSDTIFRLLQHIEL